MPSFRQFVMSPPSAHFSTHGKAAQYCLNDTLAKQQHAEDILVYLTGLAPWTLTLEVMQDSSAKVDTIKIEGIMKSPWTLDLPSYQLHTIGSHTIQLSDIHDASGCVPSETSGRFTFQVMDPPSVNDVHPSEEICVGQTMNYQVFGAASSLLEFVFDTT